MKKITTAILFTLITFTWSCEDVIDLEVPTGEVKLVVDGLLTDVDSVHLVKLSTTSPYFSGEKTPRISGATMYLTTSDGEKIDFSETAFGTGEYVVNHIVKDGINYYLNIITPDGKQYKSYAERLHRVPQIDSIYQSDEFEEEIPDFREAGYFVSIDTYEPEGVGDFYRWSIYVNNAKIIDPFNLFIINDKLYDGNPITEWDMVYGVLPGDKVDIYQMSISERAYRFWYLMLLQMQNFGSPFDTPPAEIEGNIYNINDENETVLGFFGVSRVAKASIVIVQK